MIACPGALALYLPVVVLVVIGEATDFLFLGEGGLVEMGVEVGLCDCVLEADDGIAGDRGAYGLFCFTVAWSNVPIRVGVLGGGDERDDMLTGASGVLDTYAVEAVI